MNDLDLRLWQARFREYTEIVRGWSPRTCDTYTRELKRFFEHLERQGVTNLSRLTRTHLEGYRLEVFQSRHNGLPLTQSTQQGRLGAVKQFVRFLFRENYLLLDIASGFELPVVKKRLPRTILSEREVIQLLESLDHKNPQGLRDRAMLEVFYGTGARNSELRLLELDQVDLERKRLRIDHGKGRKPRVLPLGEEALVWLEEYLAKARPQLLHEASQKLVFLSGSGKEIGRQYLALRIRIMASKAGIEKTVTPHVLRHSCATHMLKRGAGLRHLQTLLGHSSPDTTQHYTRVEISDLAKVVSKFHPREQVEEL